MNFFTKKMVLAIAVLLQCINTPPIQANWQDNAKATVTGVLTACVSLVAMEGTLAWYNRYCAKNWLGLGHHIPPPSVPIIATGILALISTPFIAQALAEKWSSTDDAQATGFKAAMIDCATSTAILTICSRYPEVLIGNGGNFVLPFVCKAFLPIAYGLYKLQPEDSEDTEMSQDPNQKNN